MAYLHHVPVESHPFGGVDAGIRMIYRNPMDGVGDESRKRIEALLRVGTRLGFLTYQMIEESLPDEIVKPRKLALLLTLIEDRGILLVDEDEPGPSDAG